LEKSAGSAGQPQPTDGLCIFIGPYILSLPSLMTLYPYFTDANSLILRLKPLPGASNNFIEKISFKNL
jgi:hypothetical protein